MKRNVSQSWQPEAGSHVTRLRRSRDTLMAGGTFGIAVAVVCCAAPLVLVALGVGAAWVVFFTDLERYLLPMLAIAAVCFVGGVWLNRKLGKTSCTVGKHTAGPQSSIAESDRSR